MLRKVLMLFASPRVV